MAQPHFKNKPDPQNDEHGTLKGTLASVIILGLIIVITWASVYSLFVSRL